MTQQIVTVVFFFFNDTATTEIYTLSLHDALPISPPGGGQRKESCIDGLHAQTVDHPECNDPGSGEMARYT